MPLVPILGKVHTPVGSGKYRGRLATHSDPHLLPAELRAWLGQGAGREGTRDWERTQARRGPGTGEGPRLEEGPGREGTWVRRAV